MYFLTHFLDEDGMHSPELAERKIDRDNGVESLRHDLKNMSTDDYDYDHDYDYDYDDTSEGKFGRK